MNQFPAQFTFGSRTLDRAVPQVMGILNVTTDSFSDGGELLGNDGSLALERVIDRAATMVKAGADILDVGGESTRPGAAAVSESEEADRVLPVIEALAERFDVVLSVDTSSPGLMEAAAALGAGLINDVRALARPGALKSAAATSLPVCLMHMQGQPSNMQDNPVYTDVTEDISAFFAERVSACKLAGIDPGRIILDPGFGFGKTFDNNLDLLANLHAFAGFGMPMLVGMSRKRMLGSITGKSEKERMAAGLAAAVIAVMNGAWIVRTHDVEPTVDALKVCRQLLDRKSGRLENKA